MTGQESVGTVSTTERSPVANDRRWAIRPIDHILSLSLFLSLSVPLISSSASFQPVHVCSRTAAAGGPSRLGLRSAARRYPSTCLRPGRSAPRSGPVLILSHDNAWRRHYYTAKAKIRWHGTLDRLLRFKPHFEIQTTFSNANAKFQTSSRTSVVTNVLTEYI